jgi:hypothetical protein
MEQDAQTEKQLDVYYFNNMGCAHFQVRPRFRIFSLKNVKINYGIQCIIAQ